MTNQAVRTCRAVVVALILVGGLSCSNIGRAAVERYKDEAAYLQRIAELDTATVIEGFESSAWDEARSPDLLNRAMVPSLLTQRVLWEPAAKDVWGSQYSTKQHGLTTNHNWARSGEWGLYEDHQGEAYPTTIRISSAATLYAVGGWFDTNPDGQSVGVLFEDRTTANDPGYYLPGYGVMYPGDNPSFGHAFIGFVDPDGFSSVVLTGTLEVNEENMLEGGNIFGADDFSIAIADEPTLPGDYNADGQVNIADYTVWRNHLGAPDSVLPTGSTNDASGYVDAGDYATWKANFGATSGANGLATTAIPEPCTAGMCLAIAVGLVTALRRRQ